MVVVIEREDTPENISKKLQEVCGRSYQIKQARLNKYFGVLKLKEDAVTLQRRWRGEW